MLVPRAKKKSARRIFRRSCAVLKSSPHSRKHDGIFLPEASQDLDGSITVELGAKGVVELELVSSGEHWGRGPSHDLHSSLKACVDSPAWRLIHALNTLVSADGNTPAIPGFRRQGSPALAAEKQMIAVCRQAHGRETRQQAYGVKHWINDAGWQESLEMLMSRATVNIEGLVGGYTGPGGKTILPHRAVAKIDLRLVPDMTAAEALASVKTHLAKQGFPDIEVNMSGGYDPNSTSADAHIIQTELKVYAPKESIRSCCRAVPGHGRDTSSPAIL